MDAAKNINKATEQLKQSFSTENWENVNKLRTGLSEMTERLEKCDKTTKEHDAISEAVKRAGTVQYMFDIGNRKLDEKPCFLVGNIPSALTSKTRDFDLINHSSKGRTY